MPWESDITGSGIPRDSAGTRAAKCIVLRRHPGVQTAERHERESRVRGCVPARGRCQAVMNHVLGGAGWTLGTRRVADLMRGCSGIRWGMMVVLAIPA